MGQLVQCEDPGARVFNRPGQDGAQDTLSSDRHTVYQAKHHQPGTKANKAIADAKAELKKIKKYREPGKNWNRHWGAVTHWVLATNLSLGTDENQKWQDKIVPAFEELGIKATYWATSDLEDLLRKHPSVEQVYFEGENRVFISLPEARHKLLEQEFVRDLGDTSEEEPEFATNYFPREDAEEEVFKFLQSDKQFLAVVGPGGVGKSRFCLEIAYRALGDEFVDQTYWANTETLAQSSAWYRGLIPELRTLLIVEDPPDVHLLKRLAEQAGTGHGRNWKVLVVLRDTAVSLIHELEPKLRNTNAEPVRLNPLPKKDAENFAADALRKAIPGVSESILSSVAPKIAARSHRLPLWMVLSVSLLKEHGTDINLPSDPEGLAERFLDEVAREYSAKFSVPDLNQFKELLFWFALYHPFDREREDLLQFFASRIGLTGAGQLEPVLDFLVNNRLIHAVGLRERMVSIVPDPLRDYILREYLTRPKPGDPDKRVANERARKLVNELAEKPEEFPDTEKLLWVLGRTEHILGVEQPDILSLFMEKIIRQVKAAEDTPAQKQVLNLVAGIAGFRPADFVTFVHAIRECPKKEGDHPNPYLRDKKLTHDDVIEELAWPLFTAATRATEPQTRCAILREMFELVQEETRICKKQNREPPNDGKRAAALLPRIIHSGPGEFSSGYVDEALALAQEQIEDWLKADWKTDNEGVLSALLRPQLAIEQHGTTWMGDGTLSLDTWHIGPSDAYGRARTEILNKLWPLVEGGNGVEGLCVFVWQLLAEANRQTNQEWRKAGEKGPSWEGETKKNLERTLEILKNRKFSLAELRMARDIWHWHERYDERENLRALAKQCEDCYLEFLEEKGMGSFEALFGDTANFRKREELRKEKALDAASYDVEKMRAFFEGALEFFASGRRGRQRDDGELIGFVTYCGREMVCNESDYAGHLKALLKSEPEPRLLDVTLALARGCFIELRSGERDEEAVRALIDRILELAPGQDTKAVYFEKTYAATVLVWAELLNEADIENIRDHWELILKAEPDRYLPFQMLGLLSWKNQEWAQTELEAGGCWQGVPDDKRANAFSALLDGFYQRRIMKSDPPEAIEPERFEWLMDQLYYVPDLDACHGRWNYNLEKIAVVAGKLPIRWLADFVEKHPAGFKTEELSEDPERSRVRVRTLPTFFELWTLIERIDPEGSGASSEEERKALKRLLSSHRPEEQFGPPLPHYAGHLDPVGKDVADYVVAQLEKCDANTSRSILAGWARFAGAYAMDSDTWKRIAYAVANQVRNRDYDVKFWAYRSLTESPHDLTLARSVRYGEFDPHWASEVEKAKAGRKANDDPKLDDYWNWRVENAEHDLELHRKWYEEEHSG